MSPAPSECTAFADRRSPGWEFNEPVDKLRVYDSPRFARARSFIPGNYGFAGQLMAI